MLYFQINLPSIVWNVKTRKREIENGQENSENVYKLATGTNEARYIKN